MRALIVGGGPAGTTAAIALGRAGVQSLVVEREDRSRPVGVGLALQNSPLRALHRLGLLEAVVDRGFHHDAVNICAPDGTVVHRILTEPLVPGIPSFVALPRETLAAILETALADTPVQSSARGRRSRLSATRATTWRPTSAAARPSGSTSSSVPTDCT